MIDDIETRARRRVGMKMGFYVHAFVFVLVNLGLFTLNVMSGGPNWSRFPLFGWGLGLAIHGLVTAIGLHGDGWRRGMLQREIESLRRNER